VDAGHDGWRWAAGLLELAERRGHHPGDLTLDLGIDPVGALASSGCLPGPWERVAAHGADAHAETAWRMMTRRDPWVNLLRSTVATFSAGIGGADTITVLPFTTALGLPDAFTRRIARNTQLILLEEAHLWRVAEPSAGSGSLEALTEALCRQAWRLFQELEREGGIVSSLIAGELQTRIAITRAAREHAIATRRHTVTGTSEFADLGERDVTTLMSGPVSFDVSALESKGASRKWPKKSAGMVSRVSSRLSAGLKL
jgi:methylmalonyl-CoA mutase N-terminal domain/subunit